MLRRFYSRSFPWPLPINPRSHKTRNYSNEYSDPTITKWPFYMVVSGISMGFFYFLGRPDEKYLDDPSRFKLTQYFSRAKKRISGFIQGFEEPAFEKLLPDPLLNDPHKKPYTLVVDLDKFLVCHIWDPALGKWRVAKRPGAEIFLFYMAQLYEVVVFSSLSQFEGDAIVKKIDPFGCINYSLYRFATHFKNGIYLKNISKLNRDLSRVIVLGHDEKGFAPHPENMLTVPPWEGDPNDRKLEDLVDFFEALALSNAQDVRTVITNYQENDLVTSYDKIQESIYEDMRRLKTNNFQAKAANLLYKLFGWQTPQTDEGVPYELKKEEIRRLRREEFEKAKTIMSEHLRAEMEKEKEYMAKHKMPFFDLVTKGPPPPLPFEVQEINTSKQI